MILTRSEIEELDLDFLLQSRITSGKQNEILILVPTNRKLRRLKKEIIDSSPGGTVTDLNLETLTTLTEKLLRETESFHELTESAAMVFLEKISREIQFSYFAVYSDGIPYGTLLKLKEVISEYKRAGVTPDLLKNEAVKLEGAERNKALDIYEIYKRYLELGGSLSAYEVGDIYSRVLNLTPDIFKAVFNKLYRNVKLITAIGFDEFTAPEAEILGRLSSRVSENLFIGFDYYRYNPLLFSHLDKTYDKLAAIGFRQIKDKSHAEFSFFRKTLRENLFKKNPGRSNEFRNKISALQAQTRKNEVESIAKIIKKLIVEKGIEPHRICVSFNLINNYSNLTRYIFRLHGIPFNITDRISLDKSLPVTSIINLLEILESDYYYKSILRAALSGRLKLPGVDTFSLINVSRGLKIVAGKSNWISRINYALRNRYDDEFGGIPEEQLNKALNGIKVFQDILSRFAGKISPDEFLSALKELISRTRLVENVLNSAGDNTEAEIKSLTVFLENIEEIFDLLNKEVGKQSKFGIEYFMNILRTSAKAARFNIKEKSDYGVLVTNVEEIRGLNFDYLFIGGMVDKDFPTQYSPEVFVSGSYAKVEAIHLTEQRYLFYRGVSAWRKGLFLSYPLSEDKREFVESTFLKEFLNLFECAELDGENFSDIISSPIELQKSAVNLNDAEKQFNFRSAGTVNLLSDIDAGKTARSEKYSEYQGYLLIDGIEEENLLSDAAKEKINNYRKRIFSISQLETYAKCSFKYYLERVLGVETVDEPSEDIAAIEFGAVVHEILFKFYSEFKKKGFSLSGCGDAVFEKAQNMIFEIAEEKLNLPEFNLPPAFFEREKLIGINGNRVDSILYKFLETERENETGFEPVMFELPFGMQGPSGAAEPIELNGVFLRGKIDRVEINEKDKLFNVVDYKIGSNKITKDDLITGLALQLPVYLYAVKRLLGDEYQPHQMIIYSLKYQSSYFGRKNIFNQKKASLPEVIDKNNELIEFVGGKIDEYVSNITKGIFPLSLLENREQKVCGYCKLKSICRISELD